MATNTTKPDTSDQDINEVFDSIAFSEERISNEAYHEGFSKGEKEGRVEGYHLGYHRGAELGAEIGFYKGVLLSVSDYEKAQSPKVESTLQKLKTLVESFPRSNIEDVDLLAVIDDVRAQFRKVSSLLKLNIQYPAPSSMSF